MKECFKKKVKSNEGFTLAELLIVVAIIAVLAIISIPIFSTKLEAAREETDISNMRSAKAAAIALYLGGKDLDGVNLSSGGVTYYYDAVTGELVDDIPAVGYGRGTATKGDCDDFNMVVNPTTLRPQCKYTDEDSVNGGVLKVYIDDAGTIDMCWE